MEDDVGDGGDGGDGGEGGNGVFAIRNPKSAIRNPRSAIYLWILLRLLPTTSITSISTMNAAPMMSVILDIVSSKLALPLKVVRTVPLPPDIASPFPVKNTSAENRTATI